LAGGGFSTGGIAVATSLRFAFDALGVFTEAGLGAVLVTLSESLFIIF
jgi:hypothetical protein